MSDQPLQPVGIAALQQMKHEGRKVVGLVVWDYQMARIAERVGADIVSVGDSVGVNLWGHRSPLEITLEEMLIVCKAVRRGVQRALLSCDLPYGPLQQGTAQALEAAIRLVKEAGAEMIKLDGAADHPEAVEALTRAGIPVFAQLGRTPQASLLEGGPAPAAASSSDVPGVSQQTARLIEQARQLEAAGAALLDFTHSGESAGAAVVAAVRIPVVGGMGGGPWLDGRMRMAHAAIGYADSCIDSARDRYANVAQISLDALRAYAADVRAVKQIKS